jgi:hypothetical protein
MLKKIMIALSTAVVIGASAAPAMAARYCASMTTGGKNCGFHSMQQCEATVSGLGGFCARSPDDPPVSSAPVRTRR